MAKYSMASWTLILAEENGVEIRCQVRCFRNSPAVMAAWQRAVDSAGRLGGALHQLGEEILHAAEEPQPEPREEAARAARAPDDRILRWALRLRVPRIDFIPPYDRLLDTARTDRARTAGLGAGEVLRGLRTCVPRTPQLEGARSRYYVVLRAVGGDERLTGLYDRLEDEWTAGVLTGLRRVSVGCLNAVRSGLREGVDDFAVFHGWPTLREAYVYTYSANVSFPDLRDYRGAYFPEEAEVV